jgi:outer membrane cobalamin receptor
VSYGFEWPQWARFSMTYGTGFRAPTFFDLYGPPSDFYQPNPSLNPEQSTSREVSVRAPTRSRVQWRLTAFDNRIEDLITFVFPTVMNVKSARITGVEGTLEATWLEIRWRGSFTAQRPRDDETGKRLPGRAERYGSLEGSAHLRALDRGRGGDRRRRPLRFHDRGSFAAHAVLCAAGRARALPLRQALVGRALRHQPHRQALRETRWATTLRAAASC